MRTSSAALSALAQYTGELYFVFSVYAFFVLHLCAASIGVAISALKK